MRLFGKLLSAFVIVCSLVLGACTTPQRATTLEPPRPSNASAIAKPSRALLELDEIKPAIGPPTRSLTQKPLTNEISEQLAEASDLAEQQQYAEAILILESTEKNAPESALVHCKLAEVYHLSGRTENAREHLKRSIELNPDCARVHYLLGTIAVASEEDDQGITSLRTALACSDFASDAFLAARCHHELAEVLQKHGYLTASLSQHIAVLDALTQIENAPSNKRTQSWVRSRKVESRRAASDILAQLDRHEEAATMLEPLANGQGISIEVRLKYAELLLLSDQAEAALRTVRQVGPVNPRVISLLERICNRLGKPEETIAQLRVWRRDAPNDVVLALYTADLLARQGQAKRAIAELTTFLDKNPREDRLRSKLFEILSQGNKWQAAVEVLAEGVRHNPTRATNLAEPLCSEDTRGPAAAALLSDRTDPSDSATAYLLGMLALSVGQADEGSRLLKLSNELDPSLVPTRLALGKRHLDLLEYVEAEQVASAREDERIVEPLLEVLLGQISDRMDDFESSAVHFASALALNGDLPQAKLGLARVSLYRGETPVAQNALNELLESQPDHEEARRLLAEIHLRSRKTDLAVAQFRQLMEATSSPLVKARCQGVLNQAVYANPSAYRQTMQQAIDEHGADVESWISIASSYSGREQELAYAALKKALKIDAHNEEALAALAKATRATIRFDEYVEIWEHLLEIRPNRVSWRLELVRACWMVRDFESALMHAKIAEKTSAADPKMRRRARASIIDTLVQGDLLPEAIEHVEAFAKDAEDDYWLRRLAELHIRQNDHDQALPILQGLAEKHPDDGAVVDVLLQSMVEAGHPDAAIQLGLDRLAAAPGADEPVAVLVSVLQSAGRPDDGLELLDNKMQQTSNRAGFQEIRLQLLDAEGRHEECISLLERMIDERAAQTNPNELVDVSDHRGRIIGQLISLEEYAEAERRLNQYLEQAMVPDTRFGYLYMLASIYDLQGNSQQALQVKERALDLRPDDVSLNNDFAYALIDAGIRLDEAQTAIQAALAAAPLQGAYLDTYGWLLYKMGRFADAKVWLARARDALVEVDAVVLDHLGDTCWRLGKNEEAITMWDSALEILRESMDRPTTRDERRVLEHTPKKILDVKEDRTPAVAPVAEQLVE